MSQHFWSFQHFKATFSVWGRWERKEMVAAGVTVMEEEQLKIKVVSQAWRGNLSTWKWVVEQNMRRSDLWNIPQARQDLIRSACDTPHWPQNLYRLFGNEECSRHREPPERNNRLRECPLLQTATGSPQTTPVFRVPPRPSTFMWSLDKAHCTSEEGGESW